MTLFRPPTATDVLFLASVATLANSLVTDRSGSPKVARAVATVGWVAFAGFWTLEAGAYLRDSRAFLAVVGLATAALSAYVATLAARNRAPWHRITAAFAVMGLAFVPYQFVLPVYHATLELVTAHTVWGLELLGFQPTVEVGVTGVPSAIRFPTAPHVQFNVVSACTGISAITLFVGLVAVANERAPKRLAVGVAVAGFVYVMNLVRTVLVTGAIGGQWFAFTAPLVTALYGVEDPALVSFYFTEHLLAQGLVVAALLAVYAYTSSRLPSLQAFLATVLDAVAADGHALRTALEGTYRTIRPE